MADHLRRRLVGPGDAGHTPPRPGWHWDMWACEFLGTALLLLGGISAVCLDFGSRSPVADLIHSPGVRRLLTGLLFAGAGSLVAVSPLGRRSGAHLNPVVTLAFWTQLKVHRDDVAGYVVAQSLGALAGAGLALLLWRGQDRSVGDGLTLPGPGVSPGGALLIEAAMTFGLVLLLLFFTSTAGLMRWTPLAVWLLVAGLVWAGAPATGTSLNPARSLGPAVVATTFTSFWVYVAGPLLGAGVAVGVFAAFRSRTVLTAKVFHDSSYPSTLGTAVPAAGG